MAREKNFCSPSGADRFFACPGSVRAQEAVKIDLPPSQPAIEGTAIHALAARCLTERIRAKTLVGEEFSIDYEGETYDFKVTDDFAYAADLYRNTILQILSENTVSEDALQVEVYDEIPDLITNAGTQKKYGGTSDCRFIAGSTLHIFDLKGGRGIIVDPFENKQCMSYAIKSVEEAGMFIEKVILWIIQPRAKEGDFVKQWETTPERILSFKEEVRSALSKIRVEKPELVAGDHCRFCIAASTCIALQKGIMVTTQKCVPKLLGNIFPVVRDLTAEQIGASLPALEQIEEFLSQLRDYAFVLLMQGKNVPGYVLTKTKKHRAWTDEDSAVAFLSKHLDTDEFMTTPKLITPAQAEKLMPKGTLKDYITQPEGEFKLIAEKEAKDVIKRSVDEVFKDVKL